MAVQVTIEAHVVVNGATQRFAMQGKFDSTAQALAGAQTLVDSAGQSIGLHLGSLFASLPKDDPGATSSVSAPVEPEPAPVHISGEEAVDVTSPKGPQSDAEALERRKALEAEIEATRARSVETAKADAEAEGGA